MNFQPFLGHIFANTSERRDVLHYMISCSIFLTGFYGYEETIKSIKKRVAQGCVCVCVCFWPKDGCLQMGKQFVCWIIK
jgi:hypothetical protein